MVLKNVDSSYQFLCVFNAHILHKKGGKLTSLELHTKLVSQMTEKYGEDTENYRHRSRPSTADNPFQLVEQHFPSYTPLTEFFFFFFFFAPFNWLG